jgi:hypothetical protein
MGEPSHQIERTTLSSQNLNLKTDLGYPISLLANRPDVKQAEFNLINALELNQFCKSTVLSYFKNYRKYGFAIGRYRPSF